MYTAQLLENINQSLAGEMLQYEDIAMYVDEAIDEINNTLNTVFPTFSDLSAETGEAVMVYDKFPDRYIRQVIIPYVCHKFYAVDEEGNVSATLFYQTYKQNLFYMCRDYASQVPVEYRAQADVGALNMSTDITYGGGLEINGSEWRI